jgi:hypothetical protein
MHRLLAAVARACRGRRSLSRAPATLAALAIAGCGYQPGSLASQQRAFAGRRATVGCFDVAVERKADLPIGPVLGYQLANRCDHLATVDLAAIAVVGRDAEGVDVVLAPYDPRAELHPVALDARSVGGESLAYPAGSAMPQVCVDLATLVHRTPPQWSCFGSPATAVGSAP